MALTYEDVIPSLIPNTNMQKVFNGSTLLVFRISACDGYVLHDNRRDRVETDPSTDEPIGDPVPGYSEGTISVAAAYDFDTVVAGYDGTTPVNKIGQFELYAILRSSVPEDQIFGVGDNNTPEIM